ncbi:MULTISPECIES: hypothetical protein [unclassified Microcoleus]|uniref:hypothetical protein n=1 Tax=unclassified Microcoleus TaxID=2642155 RepID=UPI002FD1E1D5
MATPQEFKYAVVDRLNGRHLTSGNTPEYIEFLGQMRYEIKLNNLGNTGLGVSNFCEKGYIVLATASRIADSDI